MRLYIRLYRYANPWSSFPYVPRLNAISVRTQHLGIASSFLLRRPYSICPSAEAIDTPPIILPFLYYSMYGSLFVRPTSSALFCRYFLKRKRGNASNRFPLPPYRGKRAAPFANRSAFPFSFPLFLIFLYNIRLQNIPFFDIREFLESHAALIAVRNFFDVIFKPFETG